MMSTATRPALIAAGKCGEEKKRISLLLDNTGSVDPIVDGPDDNMR